MLSELLNIIYRIAYQLIELYLIVKDLCCIGCKYCNDFLSVSFIDMLSFVPTIRRVALSLFNYILGYFVKSIFSNSDIFVPLSEIHI